MFRRKKDEPTQGEKLQETIDFLCDIEPKQMDRIIALAKEKRSVLQKIDAFVGTNTVKKSEIDFEEVE